MINYKKLPTEQHNPRSRFLDRLSVKQIFELMNNENRFLPQAIAKEEKQVCKAIDLIVKVLKSGGTIFFAGAGTSGRLGVIESAELPPTFNTSPKRAQAIMAGGKKAVFRSQEGAEDNQIKAKIEIKKRVQKGDLLIGIAASGVTPFVQSALNQSKKIGAKTVLVTCNVQKTMRGKADVVIAPLVGPEIISGSTRLKSGTATKMILNMLTTISMVRLGKVYGNRMVDLQPKSKKLQERGIRLIEEVSRVSRKEAEKYFHLAHRRVKIAILMAKKKISYLQSMQLLKKNHDFLSACLDSVFENN